MTNGRDLYSQPLRRGEALLIQLLCIQRLLVAIRLRASTLLMDGTETLYSSPGWSESGAPLHLRQAGLGAGGRAGSNGFRPFIPRLKGTGVGRLPPKGLDHSFGDPVRFLFEVIIGAADLQPLLRTGSTHKGSYGLVLAFTPGAGFSRGSGLAVLFASNG